MWWPRAMDCTKWCFCLCVFLEFCTRSSSQQPGYMKSAGQVFNTLFHKYNAGVPPWYSYPEPFEVTIKVTPIQIESVDVIAQTMTSTIDLQVKWFDAGLSWLVHSVPVLTLGKDKVWHPHIYVANAVGKVNEIDNPDLSVKIDGIITMNRRIQLTTLCDLPKGASEFNCSLKIGTDMFDADMMIFSNMSSFDIDKMVVAHSLKLTDSFFELKNVTQPNENITESMYAEFDCTLTLSETGYGSGVASHGPMLLVLMAVVIAMFAQK